MAESNEVNYDARADYDRVTNEITRDYTKAVKGMLLSRWNNNGKHTARPRGTDGAKMMLVIETKALRGWGASYDPTVEVTQYWSLDGKLLAEAESPDITEHSTP